jgi:hypothetical protein
MPADGIVVNYVDGSPVEETSENFDIPEKTIREVLAYAAGRTLRSSCKSLQVRSCHPERSEGSAVSDAGKTADPSTPLHLREAPLRMTRLVFWETHARGETHA